jgi:hypothetical protein
MRLKSVDWGVGWRFERSPELPQEEWRLAAEMHRATFAAPRSTLVPGGTNKSHLLNGFHMFRRRQSSQTKT